MEGPNIIPKMLSLLISAPAKEASMYPSAHIISPEGIQRSMMEAAADGCSAEQRPAGSSKASEEVAARGGAVSWLGARAWG